MILDGEIVAVDEYGRPSFRRLQRRWPQQRRPSGQLVREVPTRFLAFDVVNIDGEDITHWPYRERRELMDTLMVVKRSPALTVPRHWTDVAPADMLAICADQHHEGIVCKRLDSPYRSGRSRDWIILCTCQQDSGPISIWPSQRRAPSVVFRVRPTSTTHNPLRFGCKCWRSRCGRGRRVAAHRASATSG